MGAVFSYLFVVQESVYDRKIVRRGVIVFLSGAVLAALSGLSQYFLGFEFLRNKSIGILSSGQHAATSSFPHYNSLGGYLVVALLFVLALLMSHRNSRLRINSLAIAAALFTIAIIFTFSRGSWLSLLVTYIFMVALSKGNIKWFIPVLAVFVAASLFPVLYERFLFIFKESGDSDRLRYWSVAWKMINEHPFLGMGVGTFMANFSKFLPGSMTVFISYAHNCYLQIWAEAGIFALLSFLGFITAVIACGIKSFIDSDDFIILGLLAGVIGFLLHGFVESNLYSLRLAVLFWLWAGLLIGRVRN